MISIFLQKNANIYDGKLLGLAIKLFIFLCCISICVDMLNGLFFFFGFSLPISLLTKFLIMLVSMFVLLKDKYIFSFVFLLIALFFIIALISEIDSGMLKITLAFANAFKIIYPFVILCTMFFLVSNSKVSRESLLRVMKLSFVFLIVGVFVGYIGVGNSTYVGEGDNGGVGTKGLFIAGNEVAACFLVLYSFFIFRLLFSRLIVVVFFILFGAFFSVTLATKAVILGYFIVTLFFLLWRLSYCKSKSKLNFLKGFFKLSILQLFVFIFIFSMMDYYHFLSFSILERLAHSYFTNGLVGLLFSNRDVFIVDLLSVSDLYSFKNILFGHGISYFDEISLKYSAEIDPFDIFIWYGSFALVVVFFLYFILLVYSFRIFVILKSPSAFSNFISNVLVFFLAFFMGHVWLSGMLSVIIATSNALAYVDLLKNKERFIKERELTV